MCHPFGSNLTLFFVVFFGLFFFTLVVALSAVFQTKRLVNTVESRFTDTRLIQTPHITNIFLSLEKAFTPVNADSGH